MISNTIRMIIVYCLEIIAPCCYIMGYLSPDTWYKRIILLIILYLCSVRASLETILFVGRRGGFPKGSRYHVVNRTDNHTED